MIKDFGPTRTGVNPNKVWFYFQESSRGTETYKATALFYAPKIDLRHIQLAYTNNMWGL